VRLSILEKIVAQLLDAVFMRVTFFNMPGIPETRNRLILGRSTAADRLSGESIRWMKSQVEVHQEE